MALNASHFTLFARLFFCSSLNSPNALASRIARRSQLELSLGLPPESVKMSQLKFARVFSSLATLLFISTGLIYTFEHSSNPEIPDFFTALYFGLCTLTTVGFGDIVPVTPAGRAVVCASIIVGIGVVPLQVGELAESLLVGEKIEEVRNEGRRNAATTRLGR